MIIKTVGKTKTIKIVKTTIFFVGWIKLTQRKLEILIIVVEFTYCK